MLSAVSPFRNSINFSDRKKRKAMQNGFLMVATFIDTVFRCFFSSPTVERMEFDRLKWLPTMARTKLNGLKWLPTMERTKLYAQFPQHRQVNPVLNAGSKYR
jgi:hypothetical protein